MRKKGNIVSVVLKKLGKLRCLFPSLNVLEKFRGGGGGHGLGKLVNFNDGQEIVRGGQGLGNFMNFNDDQEIVCRRGTMGEMGGQGMVAERFFFLILHF